MKTVRQAKILELIHTGEVETQKELAERLNQLGFQVTQATISRDMQELKLTKMKADGGAKYALLTDESRESAEKFERFFRAGVKTLDYAGNMLVIKTMTGMAMGVAAAIDAMLGGELMGTIAGDDTIFAVAKTEKQAIRSIDKLRAIRSLGGGDDD